jgi:hypothetical protein
MDMLSRWLRVLWLDFTSSQPYALDDVEPKQIRQRLDRYTAS